MTDFVFSSPNHSSRDSLRESPLGNDSHPLSWDQCKIGLNSHPAQGNVNGDSGVVSLESFGFQHELYRDVGRFALPPTGSMEGILFHRQPLLFWLNYEGDGSSMNGDSSTGPEGPQSAGRRLLVQADQGRR